MILTIHQPEHLPWLGFFDKAAQADVIVLLDNVQYRHKYFQNRNRILSYSGPCWLNVPVQLKGQGKPLIKDVLINQSDLRWGEKCWRTLSLNYRKASFFDEHAAFFEWLYAQEWARLSDLNVKIIGYLFSALGIQTKVLLGSCLGVEGAGPELILHIASHLKADVYLSGISGIAGKGREYQGEFDRRGIEVVYQNFLHPIYPQLHEPFVPCMSAVDLLFNHGPESLRIIRDPEVPRYERSFE